MQAQAQTPDECLRVCARLCEDSPFIAVAVNCNNSVICHKFQWKPKQDTLQHTLANTRTDEQAGDYYQGAHLYLHSWRIIWSTQTYTDADTHT